MYVVIQVTFPHILAVLANIFSKINIFNDKDWINVNFMMFRSMKMIERYFSWELKCSRNISIGFSWGETYWKIYRYYNTGETKMWTCKGHLRLISFSDIYDIASVYPIICPWNWFLDCWHFAVKTWCYNARIFLNGCRIRYCLSVIIGTFKCICRIDISLHNQLKWWSSFLGNRC
jgi:hypothetical protein